MQMISTGASNDGYNGLLPSLLRPVPHASRPAVRKTGASQRMDASLECAGLRRHGTQHSKPPRREQCPIARLGPRALGTSHVQKRLTLRNVVDGISLNSILYCTENRPNSQKP